MKISRARTVVARATAVALAAILAATQACARSDPPAPADTLPPADTADPLQPLRDFEAARRASTDFGREPTSDQRFGPDPYAIRALPGGRGFVGVLRGRDAVVQLDASLHEVRRLPAPASPGALDVAPTGDVWVAGELSTRVARYRLDGSGALVRAGDVDTGGALAIRGLAVGPEGVLHVVEAHDGRLLTVSLATGRVSSVSPCARGAAIRVVRTPRHVVVDCLLDHALVTYRVDAHGVPRPETEAGVTHDGPMWGIDARESGDDLVIAAGGVEDHPLDRTLGFFGYIDSFVFLYRQSGGTGPLARELAVNTSEAGVITPKALLFTEEGRSLFVTGYGADQALAVRTDGSGAVTTRALLPGIAAIIPNGGGFAAADPLLDAWLAVTDDGVTQVSVPDADAEAAAPRSDDSKLGEALLFTSVMAPWNTSDGPKSRFTCETCHFEQTVDGRTHHTGRAGIHATTKPLLGLFNDRPYFSRALDPDLTTVANNEFRVAGASTNRDSFFVLTREDVPWVAALHLSATSWSAIDLRRAFMTYLMESTHRPNPAVAARARGRFTDDERAGAAAFRDHCESCHAARLDEHDPATRVPFEAWEELILSREGPIVWGSPEYQRTGVEPYVNELGCRTPSLRRLYAKRPYFTNGSAEDLRAVLDRAREGDARFFHDAGREAPNAPGSPPLRALDEETRRALRAFLELL